MPLVDWNKQKPEFCVADLSKGPPDVKKQFSLPYIYRVGSHQGCGCGFLKDGETGDELQQTLADYARLAAYIADARQGGADIQLFCCWEGDQNRQPESHKSIDSDALLQNDFEFSERTLYSIL
jgi:hypothetical protein